MHKHGKLVGALLLIVSLVFPMSTCSHYEDAEGNRAKYTEGKTPPKDVREVVSYNYAFEDFDPTDPGDWVTAFAFVWPVVALVLLQLWKYGAIALGVRVLEPLLITGSIFVVDFISTFLADQRALGAYLAFLALAIYAVSTVWADVEVYRSWKQRRISRLSDN